MGTPERFVTAMFWAAEVLGQELTAARVNGTWAVVASVGVDAAVRAVGDYVKEARFPRMPLPVEILDLAGADALGSADETDATAAWACLVMQLNTDTVSAFFVADRRVAAGIAAAAGDLYGLRNRTTGEADQWMQQKFVRAYVGTARAMLRAERGDGTGQIADVVAAVMAGLAPAQPRGAIEAGAGQGPDGGRADSVDGGGRVREDAAGQNPGGGTT
jgi:hypothetical protein